jgi:hypothetical protein
MQASKLAVLGDVLFNTDIRNSKEPTKGVYLEHFSNILLNTDKTAQIIESDPATGELPGYNLDLTKKNRMTSALRTVFIPVGVVSKLAAVALSPEVRAKNLELYKLRLEEGKSFFKPVEVKSRTESIGPRDKMSLLSSEIMDNITDFLGVKDSFSLSQTSTVLFDALADKRLLNVYSAVVTTIFAKEVLLNMKEVCLNAHRSGKPGGLEEIQSYSGDPASSQTIISDLVHQADGTPITRYISPWDAPGIRIHLIYTYPSDLATRAATVQDLFGQCTGIVQREIALYLYRQSKNWTSSVIYLNNDKEEVTTLNGETLCALKLKDRWEQIETSLQYLRDIVNGIARGLTFSKLNLRTQELDFFEGPSTLTYQGKTIPTISLYQPKEKDRNSLFSEILDSVSSIASGKTIRAFTEVPYKPWKAVEAIANQALSIF